MIDVMLVLLIIFMIVTPAITAGFQATIPRATNPESREENEGESAWDRQGWKVLPRHHRPEDREVHRAPLHQR